MSDSPRRIAIDARELRTSTGRYIERLIHYLQEVDDQNEYFVLLKPKDMDGWQPRAKNFQKVACGYKEFTFSEQLGFARQLYRLKVDLVHFGMVQQPLLYFRPSVTTMHDLTTVRFKNPSTNPVVFWVKQQVYAFVNWWVPRKNKAILVPTKYVKKDVMHFARVKGDKLHVTLEAADAIGDKAEIIPELKDKPFIMYVGRPMPHKNLRRLIDAFIKLKQTHPELHLALVGKKDALYEQHAAYANDKGIGDIVFTDFVSDGGLRWLYENTSAYVFPSLSEGFGLPGLEAMMHGAPVVSSRATCLPEVYGEAAHYFDPESVDDMARAIDEVLSNEDLRAKLVKKGEKQASGYSWRRMAEQTLAIYERALKS